MRARPKLTGVRLGLTYGACLALLGLTIAALSAEPPYPSPLRGGRLGDFAGRGGGSLAPK